MFTISTLICCNMFRISTLICSGADSAFRTSCQYMKRGGVGSIFQTVARTDVPSTFSSPGSLASDQLQLCLKNTELTTIKKGRTQCRRLPALCGVWGRVVFKPQTLPTQMCRGWGSNPGPSGYRR